MKSRTSSARQAILGPGGKILGWKKIQHQPAKSEMWISEFGMTRYKRGNMARPR